MIRRLLLTIPTLFILSILVFLSVRFIPGDIIDVLMEQMMESGGIDPNADREALERKTRARPAGLRPVRALAGRHAPARQPWEVAFA